MFAIPVGYLIFLSSAHISHCHVFGHVSLLQAILVALEAISAILSHDDAGAGHPWSKLLDDAGGVSRLEQLQDHESRSAVERIFAKYFA